MALIIVESPTKARTFNRILKGQSFGNEKNKEPEHYVFATMGHIRDLPAKEIAIDYGNHFQPKYEKIPKKEKVITQLQELATKNAKSNLRPIRTVKASQSRTTPPISSASSRKTGRTSA